MDNGMKRLETWAQVGILALMIFFYFIATESRLSKVEQSVQDLKEEVHDLKQSILDGQQHGH